MNWFQKNFKTIIYIAFLVPILTVAGVSISHVTKWYGLSNPFSWAIYLSIGIEIAALSALAAISAKMGKKVYFPFGIVTLIQFIGNIFFAYQYIDVNSQSFKDWVDMVDPLVSFLGVDSGDPVGHKRFLALFAGGMLPIISLSFLHMLVKFEEEDKNNGQELPKDIDIDLLSTEAGKKEAEFVTKWYGLSNPFSWAIYLSIGIEIAALSALAAISAKMGKKVYFPFGIVTLIQFIGNIFFAYQYIDVNSQSFKDWVDMVDPLVSFLGVDSGDPVGHKRFLALFAGGMLPIISLSFLHMLVKFEEEDKNNGQELPKDVDIDLLSIEAGKKEAEFFEDKLNPSEEVLQKLEEELHRINEKKFGNLVEPTVEEIPEKITPEKKVLTYTKRDA